jgi:hypothetical protein
LFINKSFLVPEVLEKGADKVNGLIVVFSPCTAQRSKRKRAQPVFDLVIKQYL